MYYITFKTAQGNDAEQSGTVTLVRWNFAPLLRCSCRNGNERNGRNRSVICRIGEVHPLVKSINFFPVMFRARTENIYLKGSTEANTAGAVLNWCWNIAFQKAGIKKRVTLHWLRHSYATHLLESGTDLWYIQELLGHKSSKTTEIYTYVSNKQIQKIKSPFDALKINEK